MAEVAEQERRVEDGLTPMEWDYVVEEIRSNASAQDVEKLLGDLGLGGWELTTSLTLPGDPRVNNGASRAYIIFKRPLKKS